MITDHRLGATHDATVSRARYPYPTQALATAEAAWTRATTEAAWTRAARPDRASFGFRMSVPGVTLTVQVYVPASRGLPRANLYSISYCQIPVSGIVYRVYRLSCIENEIRVSSIGIPLTLIPRRPLRTVVSGALHSGH